MHVLLLERALQGEAERRARASAARRGRAPRGRRGRGGITMLEWTVACSMYLAMPVTNAFLSSKFVLKLG